MKVIINKYIPFHGFVAMAFFNILIWRKEYKYKMSNKYYYDKVYNHESIHEAQMRDFCPWIPIGGVIFYIIYLIEWILRIFTNNFFNGGNSYSNLTFEKEAKNNESNLNYLKSRKRFAQWRKNYGL